MESATGLRLMRDPSIAGKASTILYLSSYSYIFILILLNVCPHTAMYVSSYCFMCVIMLICMCPHAAICVSSSCYMCPHTAIYVSSYCYVCFLQGGFTAKASHCYICVLMLLYMCPHTALCVLILLNHKKSSEKSGGSVSRCKCFIADVKKT